MGYTIWGCVAFLVGLAIGMWSSWAALCRALAGWDRSLEGWNAAVRLAAEVAGLDDARVRERFLRAYAEAARAAETGQEG